MATTLGVRAEVAIGLARTPVIGVVRTNSRDEAAAQARAFAAAGLELVEITFTVPGAPRLIGELLAARGGDGPPWFGAGTVTTAGRAREAIAAGAEFLVTPNVAPEVADEARRAGLFLVMGALSPTEIVAARALGADLVKVYPLAPVGGAAYLATVRQPLGDVPMLAAGGFGVEEIPAYHAAGAIAFGLGPPLVGRDAEETRRRVERAVQLARGGREPGEPAG
jgi:2-dehydro-3-deoxyphosphogluconate aldolase/(4S)-4-hydroxy-2-oxoglutarate aldolase